MASPRRCILGLGPDTLLDLYLICSNLFSCVCMKSFFSLGPWAALFFPLSTFMATHNHIQIFIPSYGLFHFVLPIVLLIEDECFSCASSLFAVTSNDSLTPA